MTVLITNPRERSRFLRFAVVGVIGAVVDFGLANLLTRAFQVPLVIAGAISFVAAILSNFTWNRYWTYPDSRTKPVSKQLVQFGIISVMGLLIRVPLLYFLEPVMEGLAESLGLGFPPILDAKAIGDNITLAIAVVVVMFWNFFANRYWTYGDVE
jgi:putative flippase GtrA